MVGSVALEDVLGEDAAHDAVLEQVLRLGADVGADVEQHARAVQGRHDGGDAGPADVLEEALAGTGRRPPSRRCCRR